MKSSSKMFAWLPGFAGKTQPAADGSRQMAVKSDIEIAREAKKKPIMEVGAKLGIPAEHLLPYGHD